MDTVQHGGQAAHAKGNYRFSVSIPILYGDIDAQRHLNNVVYFRFMEHARVQYCRELGLWEGQDFDTVGMILAETRCTYKAPAYLGETVVVRLRASHLGNKSFHFEYRLDTERGRSRREVRSRSVTIMSRSAR